MPTPTYDLIASSVLSSSASSVTFSSIPATYRDLVLVMALKADSAGKNLKMNFNSDTGSNYFTVQMRGNGSTTASGSENFGFFQLATDSQIDDTNFSVYITQVMDYSATDKHKSILHRSNGVSYGVSAIAGRWANTSSVTSIVVASSSGTFVSGSILQLFGIAS